MPELKHLFSPITLGKMTVKNRLVMPPMSINFGVDEDGYVTDQKTDYLAQRSAGGTGMIVVGGGAIHPKRSGPAQDAAGVGRQVDSGPGQDDRKGYGPRRTPGHAAIARRTPGLSPGPGGPPRPCPLWAWSRACPGN